MSTPLPWSTSFAEINHCPEQFCTHSPSLASFNSWILLFLCLSRLSLEFSSSQVVASTSATTFAPLFTINSAMSVFPSTFCSLARASSSVLDLMFLARMISDNSYEVIRFFLLFTIFLFALFFPVVFFLVLVWASLSASQLSVDNAPFSLFSMAVVLLVEGALVVLGAVALVRSVCPSL